MHFLTVKELNHSYLQGMKALTDISFTMQRGERVALVGANGSGKSTLLLRLAGLLWGEGSIDFCGIKLTRSSIIKLRPKIGITFQNPDDQLFCPTIVDDTAYGLLQEGKTDEEALELSKVILGKMGLAGFEKRSSFHISIGERRRAALATTLVMGPELLLLDEPFSFLDPRGKRELLGFLSSLHQTLLLATHDMDMALKLCPRVIVLQDGHIVADGKSGELLKDKTLMEETGLEVPGSLFDK